MKAQRLRAARLAAQAKARSATRLNEADSATAAAPATAKARGETAGFGSPESPTTRAAPILLAGLFGAVLLLGLALTPANAVPWSSVSRALDGRREEIAVLGAMGLFATGLLFFFVTIVAR